MLLNVLFDSSAKAIPRSNRVKFIGLFFILLLLTPLSHANKHDLFYFDLNSVTFQPNSVNNIVLNQQAIPEIQISEPVNGAGNTTFTIGFIRSANNDNTIDLQVVPVTTIGLAETGTADLNGNVTIAYANIGNQVIQNATITILDDSTVEPNEFFYITLTGNSVDTISNLSVTTIKITIIDNDVAPVVEVVPGTIQFEVLTNEVVDVIEGNVADAAVVAEVAVSYTGALNFTDTVSIQYKTSPVTSGFDQYVSASMGNINKDNIDFIGQIGILTFDATNTTRQIITIAIIRDDNFETDEPFIITLDQVTNVTNPGSTTIPSGPVPNIGTNNFVKVVIRNDDTTPPVSGYLVFEHGTGSVIEEAQSAYDIVEGGSIDAGINEVPLHVTRVGGSIGEITVPWTTTPHSAVATEYDINGEVQTIGDYESKQGTITFADGEMGTKEFIVNIVDDSIFESTEHFYVNLTNDNGAIGPVNHVVINILENDSLPDGGTVQFDTKPSDIHATDEGSVVTVNLVRTVTAGTIDEGIVVGLYAIDDSAATDIDFSYVDKVIMPVATLNSTVSINTNKVFPFKGDKTFNLEIVSVQSLLADSKVQVQISSPNKTEVIINELDGFPPQGAFQFSLQEVTINEGDFAKIMVKRNDDFNNVDNKVIVNGLVAVQYRVISEGLGNGYATIEQGDFELEQNNSKTTGRIQFLSRDLTAIIPIFPIIDGIDEGDEKFIIELFAPESLDVNPVAGAPVIGINSKITVTIKANGSVTKKAGNGAGCSLSSDTRSIDPLLPLLLLLSIFVIVRSVVQELRITHSQ